MFDFFLILDTMLSLIAQKIQDVEHTLLPRLKWKPMKKNRGSKIKRRMRSIKNNAKKVRSKVRDNVILP
jgi:hypothetical protein